MTLGLIGWSASPVIDFAAVVAAGASFGASAPVAFRRRLAARVFAGVAAAGRHYRAGIEKIGGDLDRGVEQAAGIVAQIEDETREMPADFLAQTGERGAQLGRRGLVEGADPDIA